MIDTIIHILFISIPLLVPIGLLALYLYWMYRTYKNRKKLILGIQISLLIGIAIFWNYDKFTSKDEKKQIESTLNITLPESFEALKSKNEWSFLHPADYSIQIEARVPVESVDAIVKQIEEMDHMCADSNESGSPSGSGCWTVDLKKVEYISPEYSPEPISLEMDIGTGRIMYAFIHL